MSRYTRPDSPFFESLPPDSIIVTSYKGSTHIIFPVENDYIGYVKSEITYGNLPRGEYIR